MYSLPPTEPTNLGEIRSKHRGKTLVGWVGFSALALFGTFLAVVLATSWISLAAIVLGAIFLLATQWSTPRRIDLHEEGLAFYFRGRSPRYFRFDACHKAFRLWSLHTGVGGTGVTDYELRLVDITSQKVSLNPAVLAEPIQLFTRVERLAIYPKHHDYFRTHNRGEDVVFGPIIVQKDGITISGKSATWEEIRKVELSPRLLIIRFHGRFRTVLRLRRVPFPFALIRILRDHRVPLHYFDGFKAA